MTETYNVDFIGIGAAKAGTSWLAKALAAHPDICLSAIKETNFFCREHRARGKSLRYDGTNLDRYGVFFKHCRSGQVRGEFSVHYMLEEAAAENIRQHFPEVKLLAVLREPVARLISHYRFRKHTLRMEHRSLEELVSLDVREARFGLYGQLLKHYFERFPKQHIKVLIYEEMRADPYGALADVYRYLGVDDSFVPEKLMASRVNATRQVRFRPIMVAVDYVQVAMIRLGVERFVSNAFKSTVARLLQRVNFRKLDYEPVSNETKERIRGLYREDRKVLEELLGRSLDDAWGPA
jgi:hypothetical protein